MIQDLGHKGRSRENNCPLELVLMPPSKNKKRKSKTVLNKETDTKREKEEKVTIQ